MNKVYKYSNGKWKQLTKAQIKDLEAGKKKMWEQFFIELAAPSSGDKLLGGDNE